MRRKKAFKRGRLALILVAVGFGYMVGVWNAAAVRSTNLSAAQTVSLRFPLDWQDTSVVEARSSTGAGAVSPDTTAAAESDLAMLSSEPMSSQAAVPQALVPDAATPPGTVTPVGLNAPAPPKAARPHPLATAVAAIAAAKPARTHRPGFMLNDAQIASIKRRLHLTMDQERMWPAVEAALRNIAYARAHDLHQHGAPVDAAQLASADPNSVEVQGLKSAAIPLLMSFNDEQKDEVRNLAHVMGLDQLASQF